MNKSIIFALVKLFILITIPKFSDEYRQLNIFKNAAVRWQEGNNIVDKIKKEDVGDEWTTKSITLQSVGKNFRRVARDAQDEKLNGTDQGVVCEVSSLSCRNCCEGSTGNCSHKTIFCRCDPQCTFYNDCCVDYETFCGKKRQISFGVNQKLLSCMQPRKVDMRSESKQLWVVNRCPDDGKIDEISRNCETADTVAFNITNLRKLIPVIDAKNITFRNEFCAKCNGIEDFEYFGFKIKCYVAPPASISSFAELVKFASKYCVPEESLSIFRQANQPIRECNQYFRNLCPTLKELDKECKDLLGTPDDVSRRDNRAEMRCSWESGPKGPAEERSPTVASIMVALRLSRLGTVSEVQKPECQFGEFYDLNLEMCRKGDFVHRQLKQNLDKFDVVVWFDVKGVWRTLFPSLDQTISSLGQLFNFKRSQVSALQDVLYSPTESRTIYKVIRFELQLTSEQALSLGKGNQTDDRKSNVLPLRRLLFFSGTFNLTVFKKYRTPDNSTRKKITTLTVFKTTSRQLSCIRKKTYPKGTYTIVQNGRYCYINSTGKMVQRNQVFFEGEGNGSISVCELVVFASCVGRRVNLTSAEYVKFDNLSIFYKRTQMMYDFGEYDIEDGQIFMCIPEVTPKIINWVPSDSSVVESYLTLTCFILSLTCLFLVILTYLLFPELRNLPGKNVLSLSISLFMLQLLWLIPDMLYPSTLCHIIAVIKHYLFLVSFVVMATISWDTCSAFSGRRVRNDLSTKNRENKKFYKYSVIAWGLPAMFVVTCAVVDQKGIYAVYVNELLCWFDNIQAQEYLFVLPVGLLLLFNLLFFTLTVFRIQRVRLTTRIIRSDQDNKRMFWIYLKLSTLMGFCWLFGFIYLLVESPVFSYLFVIFASLQGVYIALAFLMKKAVWKKYQKLFGITKSEYRPDYQTTLIDELNSSKETKV